MVSALPTVGSESRNFLSSRVEGGHKLPARPAAKAQGSNRVGAWPTVGVRAFIFSLPFKYAVHTRKPLSQERITRI